MLIGHQEKHNQIKISMSQSANKTNSGFQFDLFEIIFENY